MDLAAAGRRLDPRLRPHVLETALEPSPTWSASCGADVLLKAEHRQRTGSFKLRGALAKLIALGPDGRAGGVVVASSGNHGVAVAYGLQALGGHGEIFVPRTASPVKIGAIERLGAEVVRVDGDPLTCEQAARQRAQATGRPYISPYNDLDVIAGQGTIGVEIARQATALGRRVDAVVVSVGGGGLIAGIAAVVKDSIPGVEVIGVSPAGDAAMAASVAAGRVVTVDARPTLSDGTAGGLEPGAVTLDLCRQLVDSWVLVSEFEIARALTIHIETHHELIEGSAAVALAALARLGAEGRLAGRTVVAVLCGANIGATALREALDLALGPR